MKIFSSVVFLFVMCFFISCGDDEGEAEVDGLRVVINSPESNSTFNIGDEITLSFTVTDDDRITSIAFSTRSQFGTGSIAAEEFVDDITEFSGEFVITADASMPGTYPIDIIATDRNFDNLAEATISVILE